MPTFELSTIRIRRNGPEGPGARQSRLSATKASGNAHFLPGVTRDRNPTVKRVGEPVDAHAVDFVDRYSRLCVSRSLRTDQPVVDVWSGLPRARRLAERVFGHSFTKPGGRLAVDVHLLQR